MKISYDKEVDALYITLIEDVKQVKTVQLNEDIALDFAEGEVLAGIEILDVKETLKNKEFPKIILENIPQGKIYAT